MTPVQIFDSLLSGVAFTHGQLPPSVEKRLLSTSPGEIAKARAAIKEIPEMKRALLGAKFHLEMLLMYLTTWYDDDDNKWTVEKKHDLDALMHKIHGIFQRIR